jgi:PAS domain S-box-containing protein
MRSRSASSLLWAGLVLVIAPTVALAALMGVQLIVNTPELENNREQVAHAVEVIATTEALARALRDAERGQRGYLITGDGAYLAAYRAGAAATPRLLETLKDLTADSPEQHGRLPGLDAQIATKFTEMQRALEARNRDGFEAARRIVQSNVGLDAMAAIDRTIVEIANTENARLAERQARARDNDERVSRTALITGMLSFAAVGLGVIGVLGGFYTLRRSETAHRGSEDQLRRLVDGAVDYAIYMLDPDGHIRTWNAGAARIKGYRADEVIGRHFSMFYTAEERAVGAPARVLEAAARDGRYEAENWRVRKDGSRFWASVVIDAVRASSGTLLGFAKITRDVSERLDAQQELEDTRARLAQSQKMEALGQLTGGIAHDFNNMLHVVLGCIDGLRRQMAGREPALLAQLDMAQDGARRAATLTRQLLAFARRQPLKPEVIDPNRLVGGMSDILRRTLGETIAIETVLAGGMWSVSADANQLESAILNLALNARDAMPAGGRLTIETANTHLDAAYAEVHDEVTPGQYALIAVSDTGSGMARDTVERAFDPFFTTKEAGAGTGLGLSQVFGFVKQSGGHIKIYSEPSQGTTVKLYLPRHVDAPGAAVAVPAAVDAPAPHGGGGESILVVEDDEPARVSCAAMLRELGYTVTSAPDGAGALKLIDADPAIALLFTDVGLPGGMNGRQLAEAAQRRRPALKVLYTTAYARNAIVHHGRLDPGVELLVKPFTYADLAAKIRAVLTDAC